MASMETQMTSSSRTNFSGSGFQPLVLRNRGWKPLPRAGFTLVELLVVIGIIVLLMGLALPMITRAYRNAVRTRMQADLHVIAMGIEAYRADFKDIPRTDPNDTTWGGTNYAGHLRGACTLCWALVAPGNADTTAYNGSSVTQGYDGANGPGFRIRGTQGQIYGPYINPDHIKIILLSNGTVGDNHFYCFADTYGNPYLYYPANTGATITAASGYVGSSSAAYSANSTNPVLPMFDTDDNDGIGYALTNGLGFFQQVTGDTYTNEVQRMCAMLGETSLSGAIKTGETPKSTGPYILWGQGPDALGGPAVLNASTPGQNAQNVVNCDDVTNFTQ
jgi:prepilin-type N-terminal cleavage/methylation domain-containing protein